MIRSMSSKIRTDTALDGSEKQLLNLATVPLYKILSVQAYAHYALTDGEIETLSEIVAVDLLAAMLDNMLDRVEQAQTHYQKQLHLIQLKCIFMLNQSLQHSPYLALKDIFFLSPQ